MYVTQQEFVPRVVRNSAILTNAYVAGYVLGVQRVDLNQTPLTDEVDQFNSLGLEVNFTLGSLTSAAIKIEFSDDNTNWYQLQRTANTAGVITSSPAYYSLTASGLYYLNVNTDFFSGGQFKTRFIRISSSGGGTVTSSLLNITAMLGTA